MLSYQAIEPYTLEFLKRLFQEPLFSGTRLVAKYPEHSEYRALLSLTYFEDAETAPMPTMLTDTRWDEIKETICKEVEIYNKKRLNL